MLTQIRNLLSIVAMVGAILGGGYGYIMSTKYDVLTASYKTKELELKQEQMAHSETLRLNINLAEDISSLNEQKVADDKIVTLLYKQNSKFKKEAEEIRLKLRELADNDKDIKQMLNIQHGAFLNELLNSQIQNGISYSKGKGTIAAASGVDAGVSDARLIHGQDF